MISNLKILLLIIVISIVKMDEQECVNNGSSLIKSDCTSKNNNETHTIKCCFVETPDNNYCASVNTSESGSIEDRIKILKLVLNTDKVTIDCGGSFIFPSWMFFILIVLNMIL